MSAVASLNAETLRSSVMAAQLERDRAEVEDDASTDG
jgi:hypothetical protein